MRHPRRSALVERGKECHVCVAISSTTYLTQETRVELVDMRRRQHVEANLANGRRDIRSSVHLIRKPCLGGRIPTKYLLNSGGGPEARNYWDNKREFVAVLAGLV